VLETEIDNVASLRLYENLGFLREKRIFDFYLNGKDCYRLMLEIPEEHWVKVEEDIDEEQQSSTQPTTWSRVSNELPSPPRTLFTDLSIA
jgi:hypothetical protein